MHEVVIVKPPVHVGVTECAADNDTINPPLFISAYHTDEFHM